MSRGAACLLVTLTALVASASPARADDEITVAQIRAQLTAAPVYRGGFQQRRELSGIARPLVSSGQFVLSDAHGLLWQVRAPLAADYKFLPAGISQRLHGGDWQAVAGADGPAQRYLRIMLSVMSGDIPALQRDFDIAATGTSAAWSLTLRPRSKLLARALAAMSVHGSEWLERVVINERSGNRTTIELAPAVGVPSLSDAEARDFAP